MKKAMGTVRWMGSWLTLSPSIKIDAGSPLPVPPPSRVELDTEHVRCLGMRAVAFDGVVPAQTDDESP